MRAHALFFLLAALLAAACRPAPSGTLPTQAVLPTLTPCCAAPPTAIPGAPTALAAARLPFDAPALAAVTPSATFTPFSVVATGTPVAPTPVPPDVDAAVLARTGRLLVVDLGDKRLYALENGVVLRAVTVSTGAPRTPTLPGDFAIYRKEEKVNMAGPGYYRRDVPYAMFYDGGYAIHGAYWQETFGGEVSSGCVNLSVDDAAWFFAFADIGTPVWVQP